MEYSTEQRTEQWFQKRLGKFTSSQIHRLMSEPRLKADREAGKMAQGAITYIIEKVDEMLTGERKYFSTSATERGEEMEPVAAMLYQTYTGNHVEDIGFVPTGPNSGASPDGIVHENKEFLNLGIDALHEYGEDGSIRVKGHGNLEIKCPETRIDHMRYMLIQGMEQIFSEKYHLWFELTDPSDFIKIHKNYYAQMQHAMLATGFSWCDFVNYQPDMPIESRMVIIRIKADEEFQANIKSKIERAVEIRDLMFESFTNISELRGHVENGKFK